MSPLNAAPQSLHVPGSLTTNPEEEQSTGHGSDADERLSPIEALVRDVDPGVVVQGVDAELGDAPDLDRMGDRLPRGGGDGRNSDGFEEEIDRGLCPLAPRGHAV